MNDEPAPLAFECPKCGSKALTFGTGMTTLLYCPLFTDDEGRVHHHDTNTTTTQCFCRKCQHQFAANSYDSCWCGWKGGPPQPQGDDP